MNLWFYQFCRCLLYLIFKIWNRLALHGSNNMPVEDQGCIIAANHKSYLDPPVLGASFKRPLIFLAKEDLFSIAMLSPMIRWLGAIPVAGDSRVRDLRTVIKVLKTDAALVIFPEGGRSRIADGGLMPPQPGVAFLAHKTQKPILPCYIDGAEKAWPVGKKIFLPCKIRVYIGKPIWVTQKEGELKETMHNRCANEVMRAIETLKISATPAAKGERE